MSIRRTLLIPALLVGTFATAVHADEADGALPKLDLEGTFRELLDRMEPQLKELQKEMQPALDEAMRLFDRLSVMDDPRHYQLPEVLPNGDIIIRRRPDAPEYAPAPSEEEEDGSIRL